MWLKEQNSIGLYFSGVNPIRLGNYYEYIRHTLLHSLHTKVAFWIRKIFARATRNTDLWTIQSLSVHQLFTIHPPTTSLQSSCLLPLIIFVIVAIVWWQELHSHKSDGCEWDATATTKLLPTRATTVVNYHTHEDYQDYYRHQGYVICHWKGTKVPPVTESLYWLVPISRHTWSVPQKVYPRY